VLTPSAPLVEAAASGDRLEALRSLRDTLARTIEHTDSARDVAALSRQLTDVLAQIDSLAGSVTEKRSPLDELAKRRAAGVAVPARGSRAKGAAV
jgi:hypothetical protein